MGNINMLMAGDGGRKSAAGLAGWDWTETVAEVNPFAREKALTDRFIP